MTRYVLLRRDEGAFACVDVVGSYSAEAAVRDFAAGGCDGEVIVAVPEKFWRPMRVEVVTETRVKVTPERTE